MARKHITDAQVCEAVARAQAARFAGGYADMLLAQDTCQPGKVCYRALERAADRGYIEYGVSLRTGWLTDAGKALLAADPVRVVVYRGACLHPMPALEHMQVIRISDELLQVPGMLSFDSRQGKEG